LSSPDVPPIDFALDWRVLTFAMSAAIATAVLFGVGPAWLVSHVRVNDTLKSSTRGSTSDRSHNRIRHALIVGQFALALVLLAGAASFVAGVSRMIARQIGWQPGLLVTGKLALPQTLRQIPIACSASINRSATGSRCSRASRTRQCRWACRCSDFLGLADTSWKDEIGPRPAMSPRRLRTR
jgi:hypothetical protein